MRLMGRRTGLCVCATLAVVTAAAAVGSRANAVAGNASVNHTSHMGASLAPAEGLATQVARLPPGLITSATLGSPPPTDVEAGVPDRGNNWLWVDAAAKDRPDAIASAFQASFLATAFAQAAAAANAPSITGVTVRVRDAVGRLLEENAWFVPDTAVVPSIPSDHVAAEAAVARRFRDGATAIGAEVTHIDFTDVPRLVPDVTLRIKDPRAFIANSPARLSTLIGDDSEYDGRIIRVIDANGEAVSVVAYNFYTRSGEVWVNPEYEAAYPSRIHVEP